MLAPLPNQLVSFLSTHVSLSPGRLIKVQREGLGALKGEEIVLFHCQLTLRIAAHPLSCHRGSRRTQNLTQSFVALALCTITRAVASLVVSQ